MNVNIFSFNEKFQLTHGILNQLQLQGDKLSENSKLTTQLQTETDEFESIDCQSTFNKTGFDVSSSIIDEFDICHIFQKEVQLLIICGVSHELKILSSNNKYQELVVQL